MATGQSAASVEETNESTADSAEEARTRSDSESVGCAIRLNLACGEKYWEGYVNVDLPDNDCKVQPDVEADVTDLPFDDGYADEVHAIHIVEHFPRGKIGDVLAEWLRVLKPSGKLVVECPCLDYVLDAMTKYKENQEVYMRCMLALYGDTFSGYGKHMNHHWCYSINEMATVLADVGFKGMQLEKAKYHVPWRDMRMECTKDGT